MTPSVPQGPPAGERAGMPGPESPTGMAPVAPVPAAAVDTTAPAPTAPASGDGVLRAMRFLDVILVWLAAPFVIVAGLPLAGYLVGAVAWTLQRAIGAALEERGRRSGDLKTTLGLTIGGVIGRAWLLSLSILAVGLAADREDGVMACVLALVAFSVFFAMSITLRPHRSTTRP
jgi:hypothetical protein